MEGSATGAKGEEKQRGGVEGDQRGMERLGVTEGFGSVNHGQPRPDPSDSPLTVSPAPPAASGCSVTSP